MHARKNLKFELNVSWQDLLNLENLIDTIPVCVKHRGSKAMKRYSERELMTMYYKCKDCKKLFDSYITSLKKVERQLWKYYYKNYDEEKPDNDENLKLSKNWRKFANKSLKLVE